MSKKDEPPVRLAAISVDLDEILCYAQIHGLPPPTGESAHAIYRKALPRYRDLLRELGIRATFFAIGRDLAPDPNAAAIAELHGQGHEIANHTANHLYDLTRRDKATIRAEIGQGADAVESVTGTRPLGFRTPGYLINDCVFDTLAEMEVRYDSSLFPCPLYQAAKAVAMGSMRLRGRSSHSILVNPRAPFGPSLPYRVGKPYWKRGHGVLELPIAVTHGLSGRIPYIGTSLVLAGKTGSALLSRMMVGKPLVNLELHGIELADADADGLAFLKAYQPDLRRSLQQKRDSLTAAIQVLRSAGYRFVTLAEAAEHFAEPTA